MDKSIRPLRIGQRHHNLGHPRCVLLRLRVLLNQVVERSLELLHDRRDDGNIVKCRPGKRLAFLVILERGVVSVLVVLAIAGLDLVLVLIVRGGIVLKQTALLAFGLRLMGAGRWLRDMIGLHVLNAVQKSLFAKLNLGTLGPRVRKGRTRLSGLPKLKLEGLAEIVGEPATLHQVLVVI